MTDKFTNQGFHEDFDAYLGDLWEMEEQYFNPEEVEEEDNEDNEE